MNVSENDLLSECKKVFAEVVDKDRDFRLKTCGQEIHYTYQPNDTSSYIVYEKGNDPPIIQEKTDSIRKLSYSEKLNNVIQIYLYQINPIDVNLLDSMFNILLLEKNIQANTAVKYFDNLNKQVYNSVSDTLMLQDLVFLDEIRLGFQNELTLQGYIKFPFSSIMRKPLFQISGITLIWLMLMAGSLYLIFRKEKNAIRKHIQVLENIYLDTDRNCLCYYEREIELTDMYTKLLGKLLSSPDYFVSNEELIRVLYGKIENGGRERLVQLIKRIREDIIQTVPEMELKNIRSKGYQLIIIQNVSLLA